MRYFTIDSVTQGYGQRAGYPQMWWPFFKEVSMENKQKIPFSKPATSYQRAPNIASKRISSSTSATGRHPDIRRFCLTDSANNTYFIVTGAGTHTDDQGEPGRCLSVCVSEVRLPLRATFFSKEVVCL